jgi:hypothetical protein
VSIKVMDLCWPLQMPPTQKAVLISLADNANDVGLCWPSISTISERTCFGRTAVMAAIAWLEEGCALKADRSNGRHTTYVVTPESFNQSATRTGPAEQPVRQANVTSPAGEPHPSVSRTAPVRQADSNRKEPSRIVTKSNRHIRVDVPDWLPAEAWNDWCQYRKTGKGRFTDKAKALSLRTLTKLHDEGHDARALIELAIERGWQGIYAPRAASAGANGKPPIAQQFGSKTYTGTSDDELPEYLRANPA